MKIIVNDVTHLKEFFTFPVDEEAQFCRCENNSDCSQCGNNTYHVFTTNVKSYQTMSSLPDVALEERILDYCFRYRRCEAETTYNSIQII